MIIQTVMSTRSFSQLPGHAPLVMPTSRRPILFKRRTAGAAPTTPEAGVSLPFPHGRQWVAVSQIIRFEGEGNYTHCHFREGPPLLVALSLKVFAKRMPAGAFVRVHRKHLLNLACVASISYRTPLITLTNGEQIPVARRRVSELRRAWRGNE